MRAFRIVVAAALIVPASCESVDEPPDPTQRAPQSEPLTPDERLSLLADHMVAFDSDGTPLDPSSDVGGWFVGDQRIELIEYRERVHHLADRVRAFAEEREGSDPPPVVVMYVHGGLNTHGATEEKVLKRARQLKAENVYPIFIAWNSSLPSSYFESLHQRDGHFSVRALLAAPYVVVSDLARGIINIPPRGIDALMEAADVTWNDGTPAGTRSARSIAQGLRARYASPRVPASAVPETGEQELVVPIEMGEFRPAPFHEDYGREWYRYGQPASLMLLPVRSTLSFVVDAFGKTSWETMQRRVKLLVNQEDGAPRFDELAEPRGLTLLLRELGRAQVKEPRTVASFEALLRATQGARDRLDRPDDEAAPDPKDRSSALETKIRTFLSGGLDELKKAFTGAKTPETYEAAGHAVCSRLFDDNAAVHALQPAHEAIGRMLVDPHGSDVAALSAFANESQLDEKDLRALVGLVDLRARQHLELLRQQDVEFRLIGHSMGAIVVNQLLHQGRKVSFPRFRDVVYLAAACSMADYEDTIFPYLAEYRAARMHHVVLHPRAEADEITAFDLAPRGSLLVWIDRYLSNPQTRRDRTAGQFVNLMFGADRIPPSLGERISIKVLGAGSDAPFPGAQPPEEHDPPPDTHGGFTARRFWEPWFFDVAPAPPEEGHRAPTAP